MQKYNKNFDFPLFSCNFVHMKLSVIVPVYKVEATLDRCVDSIVRQTFTDLEIILVDDGSPDRCPQMCEIWATKDCRIRTIHKTNGGLSDARNAGLDVATGDYITFVDSDDYLQTDTYKSVLPLTDACDIVEFPIYRFYGSEKQSLLSFQDNIYSDIAFYWLKQKAYRHTYACNKIYKTTLFENIRFPKGHVFEDAYTFPLLLQKANRIGTSSYGLYFYCHNDSGITISAQGKELTDLLNSHLKTMRIWCDDTYYMHILNIQMDVYEMTELAQQLPFRCINPFVKSLSIVQRFKAIMHNIVGVRRMCILNKIIHQWKNKF